MATDISNQNAARMTLVTDQKQVTDRTPTGYDQPKRIIALPKQRLLSVLKWVVI